MIRRLWPQGSLGLLAGIPRFYLCSHPQEPRGQKQALGMAPGLLRLQLPAAPKNRAVPFLLGKGARATAAAEVVSSVCWVSLCQASPVRTRRPQIFQAPVSQRGHLVRVLSRSPQTHQATRNPKAPGKTGPGSRVPKRLGCGTQGSARLFLLPDPTSRVRTECDLQTRRAGAGGGRAQAQVRLGGPTGTGSLPLSPSVAASAAVRTD